MKIMIICSEAISLINFRWDMLCMMKNAGCQLVAIAPEANEQVQIKLKTINCELHIVPYRNTGISVVADVRLLWQFRRLIITERPDCVFAYTIKPVIYGLIAARMAGVKKRVALITGLGYVFIGTTLKARLLLGVVKKLYKISLKGSVVLFQNPDDQSLFVREQNIVKQQQAAVIAGSGVDLNYFKPVRMPDTLTFLLTARLLKDKGIIEYVAAATEIKQQYPGTRFLLLGRRDSNPACISQALLDQWIENNVVEYLGVVSDVRPIIAQASVFVLPSYREGTPRSVLEAMAMGRPIITTDVPGCRETVIEGSNGFLVPEKSVSLLAQAIEKFISNPELVLQMGAQSRKIAEDKYDVHKVNAVMLTTLGIISHEKNL